MIRARQAPEPAAELAAAGPSDEALLARFCAGDRGAFDAIFRSYAPRVHATAWRLTGQWEDAEDALQEVFLRLAAKAASIRRQAALGPWLYRTTLNCATDRLRRRETASSLDADAGVASRIIAIESLRREQGERERRLSESLLARVEGLILRLPRRQAEVFVLRFFQGLPHREIAAILEIAESTAKSLHSHACSRLRELIAAEDAVAAKSAAAGARKAVGERRR